MYSKSEAVQKFLDDLLIGDSEKYESIQELRIIVLGIYPKTTERIIYGGIMFTLSEDFGGLFVSKNHISFEFGKGYLLNDPNSLLEGKGKFRRHLKIRQFSDIDAKYVSFFVKQIESL